MWTSDQEAPIPPPQAAPAGARAAKSRRTTCSFDLPTSAARRLRPLRSPLSAIAFVVCLLSVAHPRPAARGHYEVQEIATQVFVWVAEDILDQVGDPLFNRGGTAGFIITTEGVVMVNTTNSPFHARELLYEVRRRTDQPIRYVVNTDAAGDRMLGNEVFADLQATIISTIAAYNEMWHYQRELSRRIETDFRLEGRMRGVHVTVPTQTFDAEMALLLGGREIKILNLGGGHSMGDAAVYLADAKVLFLGHLFQNHYFPRVGSGNVRRWVEILREVEGWDVDTYVPGHGEPAGKKELAEFRQFLEWLTAEVEGRLREGQPLAQVRRELDPREKYPWRGRDLAPRAVEAVYKQLASR